MKKMLVESVPQHDPIRDLLAFHNVARALTSSNDRDSTLRVILQQTERFFHPEIWSVLLVEEGKKELSYVRALSNTVAEPGGESERIGHGIARWVGEHGETLIVPELALDPRFTGESEALSRGVRSVICIPLCSRSRTLGVIQLFNWQAEKLTDYTLSVLHVLCDYAAIAIENALSMDRIRELTITDDCTALYNVRHLYTILGKEIERARRFKDEFSLIFIDLDHFKDVNDKHGHLVGSRLLAEIAQRVRIHVRAVDSAFRFGGDEFVILLPGTRKFEATHAAQRLWQSLRSAEYLRGENLNLKISASFGVATFPEDGQSVHEMIGSADETMYQVKNTSRDAVGTAGGPIPSRPLAEN